MARPSKPHLHRGKWRVRINGKEYNLGKHVGAMPRDPKKAKPPLTVQAEFEKLSWKAKSAALTERPVQIAEVIEVWLRRHPNSKHLTWLSPFNEFAGRKYLDEVTDDLLHNYHDYLLKATYQPRDRNGEPLGDPKHYAQETVRNYMRDAAAVMAMATRRRWCEAMPEVPAIDKPEYVDRSIDPAKLWAALDALPPRAGRILRFIAATGCRPDEACRLQWKHVKLPLGRCILPRHKTSKKTGEPRRIPLTPESLAVLREDRRDIKPDDEHVFLSRFNRPYTVQGLRSIMMKHVGATTYDLRHTFAQAMIDQGYSREQVAAFLGQRTSRMVDEYARERDEQLTEAAAKLIIRPAAEAG